ncbi:MAG: hypothetical protein P1P86_16475 [Bacteroidales bacterium]|nr:hypothetical protein [Bacteroidales bacterium]
MAEISDGLISFIVFTAGFPVFSSGITGTFVFVNVVNRDFILAGAVYKELRDK